MVPCTAQEIRERIELKAGAVFMLKEVPELLFWHLGLEFVRGDVK